MQQANPHQRRLERAGRGGAGDGLAVPHRGSAAGARDTGVDAVNDDGPSVVAMVLAVAAIVALVILVFFALGYLFGRLFL